MLSFKGVDENENEVIFTVVEGADILRTSGLQSSYPIANSPWAIPSDHVVIPGRQNATTAFVNNLARYVTILDIATLAGHTFTLDNNHTLTFNTNVTSVTFSNSGITKIMYLSSYCTLPYADDVIRAYGYNDSYSLLDFSWYGDTPNDPRIYASTYNNSIPEVLNASGTANFIYDFWQGVSPYEPPTDPYGPGGTSGRGGGGGTFDGTSQPVDFPPLPTLSAVDTRLISLFNPTIADMRNLADFLWSDSWDVATWKKLFADPMDAILGLSIVPVDVPDGGAAQITVGNIPTGVSVNRAANQYVEVDCGSIEVAEFWGAYLDYDPYTKAEIYLPYVGTHPLSVDDIMGKVVHVKYHVDILSGACCAYVKCGQSVLYSWVGQCSCSIPITGNDWTNVINGALSIASSIGSMVATGGLSAPMAISSIASTAANSMKPSVEKSGSLGGMGGMLGIQIPYLMLTRPRQAIPENQNAYMGYPSFITMTLGDCSGYTEIEMIHLENIPATNTEIAEIETLLKGGVIL